MYPDTILCLTEMSVSRHTQCKERTVITKSPQPGEQTNLKQPAAHETPRETKPRIAVLDDNADMRHLLRAILERHYIVNDFDNAAGMLEFLEQTCCDLIISDLSLPQMDGFDFVFALKQNIRIADIPVVAFTASGSDQTRRRALAAGFVAYLEKPVPIYQLLSVIAHNLRRPV